MEVLMIKPQEAIINAVTLVPIYFNLNLVDKTLNKWFLKPIFKFFSGKSITH